MSFTIKLGVLRNEKRAVSKNVLFDAQYEGVLKEDCSIIDPVIIVQDDLAGMALHNYMQIEVFSRFYFIENFISIDGGFVEIHAHVDVLASFAYSIYELRGIIAKQSNAFNLYLEDGSLRELSYPTIRNYAFSSGFDNTTGSYVLSVAGQRGNNT